MAMRLSGLASGMDTESIVKELMAAHNLKKQKVEKKQTKLEWKKEKWQDLNTKLYNLYTKKLSALRFTSAYSTKKVTATQTDKVDIKALSSAVEGTHTVSVNKLASAAHLNSGKFDNGVTGSTKLKDLGIDEGTQFNIKVGSNEEKVITVDSSTSMDSFAKELKDLGLNASYDSVQKRFFISSKTSGLENDFSITSTGGATYTGLLDVANKQFTAAEKELEVANKAWVDAGFGTDDLSTVKSNAESTLYSAFDSMLTASGGTVLSTTEQADIKAQMDIFTDTSKNATEKEDAKNQLLTLVKNNLDLADPSNVYTTDDIENMVASVSNPYTATVMNADAIDSRINDAQANYDSKQTLLADAQLAYDNANDPNTEGPLSGSANPMDLLKMTETNGANMIAASDSEIVYNGALLTSSSNTITVNGIEITAKDITDGEAKLTVSKDVDAVYDQIKDFIKEYNAILEEMNKLYSAKPVKGYEPLTDDEKGAMSDSQVEKWESLIQGSLFRRDSTLGGIINSMKGALSSSVKVNDKNYSLINFGISTSKNYTEGGLLHIFGDKDDPTFADQDDKLRAALQDDPDTVVETLSGIMSNLYSEMTKKMASSTISSALTFYNDKSMNKEIDSYKDQISKMEKKLTRMEDNYYKRFTAMEKALSKMNSQNSQLTSMLGMGA